MTFPFEHTGLWQRSLGATAGTPNVSEKARLCTTLETFRARVQVLVARISHALPDLTVHDITHLDAMWETADVIAGPDYPINPMEAFVFGGAVLLHDAGLCFEAYDSGLAGVRQTVEWRDAYAAEIEHNHDAPSKDIEAAADFSALRMLHANHAAILADRSWQDPDVHTQMFLIEDHEIRKRYGGAHQKYRGISPLDNRRGFVTPSCSGKCLRGLPCRLAR
jgi:hypothetical protein